MSVHEWEESLVESESELLRIGDEFPRIIARGGERIAGGGAEEPNGIVGSCEDGVVRAGVTGQVGRVGKDDEAEKKE